MPLVLGGAARQSGAAGCKYLGGRRSFPSCGTLPGQFLRSLVASFCLPAILTFSAAFLHLWFPCSRSCPRAKEGWEGGGSGWLEGKVPCPKLPSFPTALARHYSPQQPVRGDAGKPSLLGGSSVQEKMPIPSPLCVQPVHCSGVRPLHRAVRPCTEARSCAGAACRGLPIPLPCPGTQPAARWGEGTAPAWEGAHLPKSQQREGSCSPSSTKGPYKPHLAYRHPRELLSRAHGASVCPGD